MPIYIALIGRPGTGKSAFINAACGEKLAAVAESGSTSCTRTISQYSTRLPNGKTVIFIDTPGYRDGGTPISTPWRPHVLRMLADYAEEHHLQFQFVLFFQKAGDASTLQASCDSRSQSEIDKILLHADLFCRIVTHCDLVMHPQAFFPEDSEQGGDKWRFYGYARGIASSFRLFFSGKNEGSWYRAPTQILQSILATPCVTREELTPVAPHDEVIQVIAGPDQKESQAGPSWSTGQQELEQRLEEMTLERDYLVARCQQLVLERDQLQVQLDQKTSNSSASKAVGPRDTHTGDTGPKEGSIRDPEPGTNHPQTITSSSSQSNPPSSGPKDPAPILTDSTSSSSERQKRVIASFDACTREMLNITNILDEEVQHFQAELEAIASGPHPVKLEYQDAVWEIQVMQDELEKLSTIEYPRVLSDHQALLERQGQLANELDEIAKTQAGARSGSRVLGKTKKRLEDSLADVHARLESTRSRLVALKNEHAEGEGDLQNQVDEINRLWLALEAWLGFDAARVDLNYPQWPINWMQEKRSKLENNLVSMRQRLMSEWRSESPSKAFVALVNQGTPPGEDRPVDWRELAISWYRHYALMEDVMGGLDGFRGVPDVGRVKKAEETVEEYYRGPLQFKRCLSPKVTPLGS